MSRHVPRFVLLESVAFHAQCLCEAIRHALLFRRYHHLLILSAFLAFLFSISASRSISCSHWRWQDRRRRFLPAKTTSKWYTSIAQKRISLPGSRQCGVMQPKPYREEPEHRTTLNPAPTRQSLPSPQSNDLQPPLQKKVVFSEFELDSIIADRIPYFPSHFAVKNIEAPQCRIVVFRRRLL